MRDPSTQMSDGEGVMWEFRHKLRALFSGLLETRRSRRHGSPGRWADWMPPVLGPEDYSIGMLADRSANWYFDRN